MKVLIAGAGSVGRSIAQDLINHGHDVVIMDHARDAMRVAEVEDAEWVLGDSCEMSALARVKTETMDVVVAATGDDKVNLVTSFLAKTEFGVPRTVARVNNPRNEWLYDAQWGVDVAVSTPRIMTAMVEEAVAVGDLVTVFTLHQSGATIMEVTLPASSPLVGSALRDIEWPPDTVLTCIVREDQTIAPTPADTLEQNDQLLFVVAAEVDPAELSQVLQTAAVAAEADPAGRQQDSRSAPAAIPPTK